MTQHRTLLALALAAALGLTACGGSDEPEHTAHEVHTAAGGDEFNDADVAFATEMIQHHAQALAMVDLTLGRKLAPAVSSLAEEIRMAQAPEIQQMTTWLTDWEQPVPETVRDHANAHGEGHGGSDSDVPGMMSEADMAELEAARGADFEQLWLEMMIEHHEGAVAMAEDEGEDGHFDPAVELAGTIVEAQEAEIATMRDLLGS